MRYSRGVARAQPTCSPDLISDSEVPVKVAVIAPTSLLDPYGTLGDGYHLCLSDQVQRSAAYARFYRERRHAGDYVILDNSAHEQLEGDSLDDLLRAARAVEPSEIVLPDRLFFGDDTVERSTHAYTTLRREFPHAKLMGVPQGRLRDEWIGCLESLVQIGVDTIGISKDYEVWAGGLRSLVRLARMYGRCVMRRPIDIHLLGWGRALNKIADMADDVRGIDSAKPLVYALAGVELPDVLTETSIPKYPRRNGDYFSSVGATHDFDRIARHNIGVFQHYARGGWRARGTGFAAVGS